MSFENLGLVPELVRAVATQGYTEPTPIQAQAIPHVLTGGDLMAGAQTGTGKTAAFALPMLQRLSERNGPMMRLPRALVLVPTRELAAQVHASFRTYGRHMALRTVEIFGGVGMPGQVRALRAGVDIVVATPGRLLDHVKQRTVDLSAIEILVLDEADRMLDMGFLPDVERILKLLGGERQTLLFSATFPDPIRKLAQRFQRSPALIEVARRNAPAAAVEQIAYRVDSGRKRELLSHLIWEKKWAQVLVFTRTKHGADRLAKQLGADKIDTAVIHGNKSQSQRIRALHDFKKQSVRVLVATDIAARGIDIDELPNVVNYELPHVPEDYVHRIGRTGRAGNAGTAVSLVCAEERGQFDAIRRLVGVEIATLVEPGFEPLHGDAPGKAPQQRQGNPGNRQGRNGGQGQPRRNAGRGNDERRPQRQDAPRADERQPQRNDNRSFDSRQPGRNDNRRFDSRQPGRNDNRRFDGRQPGRNANSGFDARQPERNDNRSFDARQPERNDNRSFDARQPERNDNRSFDARQPERNDNRSIDFGQPGRNANRRFDGRQPGRNGGRRADGQAPTAIDPSRYDEQQPERNDNRRFEELEPRRLDGNRPVPRQDGRRFDAGRSQGGPRRDDRSAPAGSGNRQDGRAGQGGERQPVQIAYRGHPAGQQASGEHDGARRPQRQARFGDRARGRR